MNPELSRRVAKVMHSSVIAGLEPTERQAFAMAVSAAQSFDDLPDNYKQMILQAEGARTAKVRYTKKGQ